MDSGSFVIENGVLTQYTDTTAQEAVVPPGVTKIGLWAFLGRTSLRRVILPESLLEIGYEAFKGCTELRHINIPRGIRAIGAHAFSGCFRLTDLSFPQGVAVIGSVASRKSLETFVPQTAAEVRADEPLTPIDKAGDFLVQDGALLQYFGERPHVAIPPGIHTIKSQAFLGCLTLRQVDIPDSVSYIHDRAFAGCAALGSVTLPPHPVSFGQGVFSGCTALTDITLYGWQSPDLFAGCTALARLRLDGCVTEISSNSYSGCTGLRRIDAPGATAVVRSWGFWPSASVEVVGNPAAALVAPLVDIAAIASPDIRRGCLLGYLAAPECYSAQRAGQYERYMVREAESLLLAACRHGLTSLVRRYSEGAGIEGRLIGPLIEAAQAGGHPHLAALLLDYRHRHGPVSPTRQAQLDMARLLEE